MQAADHQPPGGADDVAAVVERSDVSARINIDVVCRGRVRYFRRRRSRTPWLAGPRGRGGAVMLKRPAAERTRRLPSEPSNGSAQAVAARRGQNAPPPKHQLQSTRFDPGRIRITAVAGGGGRRFVSGLRRGVATPTQEQLVALLSVSDADGRAGGSIRSSAAGCGTEDAAASGRRDDP
jgi:hypothetical protein